MPRELLCCKVIHSSHDWKNVYPLTRCPGYRGGRARRLARWVVSGLRGRLGAQ